jgi:tetratricopeptide (TPR) repeat protein
MQQSIPGELIDQFSRGNGSIFVGAGVSVGAGLPSWADLVLSLTDDIGACPQGSSFLDIAQYYAIVKGRMFLVQHLRRALGLPKLRPTKVHEALVNLKTRHFFTTNFDGLLEEELQQQGLNFNVITRDEHVSFWDESTIQLVKLHGDFRDPESIVLTAEDYEDYPYSHSSLADLAKVELQTRTVLFLGYSFNDIDLRMILTRVSRESRRFKRNLFTIQFNPSELAMADLNRRGLTVIRLQPEDGSNGHNQALCNWLYEFGQRLDQARREGLAAQSKDSAKAPTKLTNHNLPQRSEELLGRQDDFARVMEGLGSRYPLITIEGFPGIGKTSLAIEVGYACALNRKASATEIVAFEYVAWITTKDNPEQPRWLDDVLNVIAQTMNFSAFAQLPPDEKKLEIDRLLRTYKALLIIDNFETVHDQELLAWLEQLPEPSKVMVTTQQIQHLQKAWAVRLEGMKSADALILLRQHGAQLKLDFLPKVSDATLLELWKISLGNPQAMKLALGLVHGGELRLWELINQIRESRADQVTATLLKDLFERSWQRLPEPARQILLVTPLFVGVSSIREDALQAVTGLPESDFAQSLEQCLDASLLESDLEPEPEHGQQRYVIHPMIRAFAQKELDTSSLQAIGRQRCSDYFLEFVRTTVKREKPEPRYWNALVSDGMKAIDPEWPSILEVMKWSDQEGWDERLVEFVMLLVHYMDSRFLNTERLLYVRKAITALSRLKRKEDEALLKIDALGWTYVEEDRLLEAYDEILAGYHMAEEFAIGEKDDLLALGLAWRARIKIEQNPPDPERALQRIGEALAIKCQPWIRCRVNMAAGDIALKRGNGAKALTYYKIAESEAQKYGGEGHGYQTLPRIGLAYLAEDQLQEAEQTFKELQRHSVNTTIIGDLYAEYGLAMVAYKKKDIVNARVLLDDVNSKLSRRTASNLLLKLIKNQEVQLRTLGRSSKGDNFNVFLSYNSEEFETVRQLASTLKARRIRVWLDRWELIPGRPWQDAIEAVMERIESAAVLVGGAGLGPWQNQEMRSYLDEFVQRGLPVIPVLLPGSTSAPELPRFLRSFTWVDLRDGLTDSGIDHLIWGITGERPSSLDD